MRAQLGDVVQYQLPIGDELLDLNPLLGKSIAFSFSGNIHCCHCGRKTKKSYSQGYCFPCTQKLAQCDLCILKPETCHFDQGTCREPEWAQSHCMTSHYVYLSNTSGLKVGITRATQIPTRWIDQGAVEGLLLYAVKNRKLSGQLEIELAKSINDKTNWRTMLKGEIAPLDLREKRDEIKHNITEKLQELALIYGADAIEEVDQTPTQISYPVLEYPKKIVSHNLDKNPEVSGTLLGIKGQYLILDSGVINMRKYTSYELNFQV